MLVLGTKRRSFSKPNRWQVWFLQPSFLPYLHSLLFFYTNAPGPPLELVTDCAACPVCVCGVVIVVRGWARGFTLPCGSAAGCAITSEHIGGGRVGKSEQHLKWQFGRWFNSLFMGKLLCPSNHCLVFSFHFSILSSRAPLKSTSAY